MLYGAILSSKGWFWGMILLQIARFDDNWWICMEFWRFGVVIGYIVGVR